MWASFVSELTREIKELMNYRFNLIFANLSLVILFAGFLNYFDGSDPFVIFFMLFCWYFATHSTSMPTYILEDELLDRTLITILQSRTSIIQVLLQRSLIQVVVDTLKAIPVFTILALVTQVKVFAYGGGTFFLLIALSYVIIFALYGVGFLFSGFVLLFKRTSSLVGVLNYYLLFFTGMTLPLEKLGIFRGLATLFPFVDFNQVIVGFMNDQIVWQAVLLILVKGAFYWGSGLVIFHFCLQKALKKGGLFSV